MCKVFEEMKTLHQPGNAKKVAVKPQSLNKEV
jgi:hypothetical protein